MKKFFSCMIMAAVVLGMASCGEALDPNDPNEYCFIVTYVADGDPVTLNVWATNSEMLEEVLPGIAADGHMPNYKKVDAQSERECDNYTEEEDEPALTPQEMIIGSWDRGVNGSDYTFTFTDNNECTYKMTSEIWTPYTHYGSWVYVASQGHFEITWTTSTMEIDLSTLPKEVTINKEGTEIYYQGDTYTKLILK